jgi:hypothetical protein
MAAEKPSVTKLVISLDQLDSVALSKTQLVGASSLKVI